MGAPGTRLTAVASLGTLSGGMADSGPSLMAHAERVERLTGAVEELAAEVGGLREVLDELRLEIQWGLRNDLFCGRHPAWRSRLMSVPPDTAAEDFAEFVNAGSPHEPTSDAPPPPDPGTQGELF